MDATRPSAGFRWWAVPWPVWLVAGLMVAGLLGLSGAYGFHGDEMYFVVAGRHPAFGYVDQPPLTPLLSAASVAILGVSPEAVRILPAVEMALVVIVVAFVARDLGGSRRAQVLAAVTASVSGYLGAGHLATTTELDLLVWAVVMWLLVRVLAGGDARLWLAVGVSAGIGLENKDTLTFLAAGLAVGVLLCRRWDVARSPWAWAGVVIAAVLWAPNLIWQSVHGWPQLTMASQIAGYAATNRAQILPFLWLFTGPLLFPVCIAGLVWVLGSRAAAVWRPLGIAAVVAMVLVLLSGGKAYYAIGSAPLFMAAGGIVLDRWIARGHRWLKLAGLATAAVVSGALVAVLTLPVLPVADYAETTLPATVPDTANQIGWPQFVATVEQVVTELPPEQRAHAMILANDYSEASPLILLGKELPPVYSGHNSYWTWGPPPAERTVVVHVGDWRPGNWAQYFTGCRDVAHIDNRLGIDNSEQGKQVTVCAGIRGSWTTIWPAIRTIS
ncbi:glycosyltransferase family 39 protein [Actinoplanes sp. NPDC051513]|uniref:glycosyltransferase family 39 protein n=1 Tax=Actinoplanes sp. NPDC051513 TaxID=3363908 RepID=UPI00379EA13E